jgi:hypothetical protein
MYGLYCKEDQDVFRSLPASVPKMVKKCEVIADTTNVFINLVFYALWLNGNSDIIQTHFIIIFTLNPVPPDSLEFSTWNAVYSFP